MNRIVITRRRKIIHYIEPKTPERPTVSTLTFHDDERPLDPAPSSCGIHVIKSYSVHI